jgi:hypothetical protein
MKLLDVPCPVDYLAVPLHLAWRLKTFDIRSQTIRIGDHRAKGYDLADFLPSKT